MFRKLALASLLTTLALPALAADMLGARTVAYGTDTDIITVPGLQLYRQVRLCVSQRDLHMQDVDVHFGNGGHDDLWVRNVVPAGQCTRWIDLNGPARNITSIVLRYDAVDNYGPHPIVTAEGR